MENKSEIIAAIDIGTTKIVALAGRKTPGQRLSHRPRGAASARALP